MLVASGSDNMPILIYTHMHFLTFSFFSIVWESTTNNFTVFPFYFRKMFRKRESEISPIKKNILALTISKGWR